MEYSIKGYKFLKQIGKGVSSKVYLAQSLKDGKTYAIKQIERTFIKDKRYKKYINNEIFILKNIKNDYIIKFYEIIMDTNYIHLVFEYCNGGDLDKCLKKQLELHNKSFSQEVVQHIMRQVIAGFVYLHSSRILHRDIKLENILVQFPTEEDKENLNMMKAQCKIIDFGFACRISKSGLQYSTLGSPINMDPIILKKLNSTGRKSRQLGYDQKADIWSLGTICYEMLIGKSAFDAEDMDELVSKIEDGTYTVPTNLSREVISFLNAMLQYDSHARLNSLELSRHVFLTKDVKDFHPIDMQKVSKKVDKKGLNINVKRNKSIWAIFNADDEDKLNKITGNQFDKPIDEREEFEHEKQQRYLSPGKKEINNNEKVEPEIRQIASFPMPNISGLTNANSYSGPMLPNPSQGIPGNPIHQQIQGMSQDQQGQGQAYVFSGGIFG